MRLRHKKNAENDILDSPMVINLSNNDLKPNNFDYTFSNDNNKTINTNNSNNKNFSISNTSNKFLNPNEYFKSNEEIHLELGMGKGKFVTELSQINKNINYIGIERSATIVLKAIDRLIRDKEFIKSFDENYAKNNNSVFDDFNNAETKNDAINKYLTSFYPNLKFMCLDIAKLCDVFAPHSIDKIYLNFSDPWPKKRHESRRLTHKNFLSLYEKILKPESFLEFKTDNKELFDFSIEEIKNSNFEILEFTYDLHNDPKMNLNNIMTEYEEKFSKLGNKICKLIAKI